MPVVRRSRADLDRERMLAELAAQPMPSHSETERQTVEDGNAWTAADVREAVPVCPPPTPQQVRALRSQLGLSQAQFAHRSGSTMDSIQQYKQGRRVPSGPASTLLRVIAADPAAVERALNPRRKPAGRNAPTAE